MVDTPVVVLKFGSSVLVSPQQLPLAVQEIYAHWRAGRRVVAVVSAFSGVTDQRLTEARALTSDLHAQAAYVADGERAAADHLVKALSISGVSARYADVAELALRAQGDPHESLPFAMDAAVLRQWLTEFAAVVLPGFVAHDEQGRCVLLGRGGSDLSALFVANALQAQCRLVKDVDGVYDRDPQLGGVQARRFSSLSWGRALQVGGKVIQPRALAFAQACHQSFEVACVGSDEPTLIGPGPDAFAPPSLPDAAPLRVVLLGLGTVGLGVYAHLVRQPQLFEVVRIAVRDATRPRYLPEGDHPVPQSLLTDDFQQALSEPADLVIETLCGVQPAGELVHAALLRGRAVVSANKALIASRWWPALASFAAEPEPLLRFSAAVGGAVPVLETVEQLARSSGVVRVRAVLNGTCNFMLSLMEQGVNFEPALAAAQAQGFAEADPGDDLSGLDAARKLELIARAAFADAKVFNLHLRGIVGLTASLVSLINEEGLHLRLVAACEADEYGVHGEVRPCELRSDDFLAGAQGEDNRIEIFTADGAVVRLSGKGAGRWPTAQAILGDVHAHLQQVRRLNGTTLQALALA